MWLGQFGRHLQPPGTLGDAGREHFLLAADQRIELALRNPRARCDLERAGLGKAVFHERRERRVENAPARRNLIGSLLRFRCRSRRHDSRLTWYQSVPYIRTRWYRTVPTASKMHKE